MKKQKTTLQIIADWLAKRNLNNQTIFKVRSTDKVLVVERTTFKKSELK